jgi:CDP-4-dehydro-6-deoxyglucose reductase
MSQRLPVFRAARLVGVTRSTLQKKIRQQGIPTFEGEIAVDDLLKLYPQTELQHDSEYERVQYIKQHAFAKRVRERLLPSVEVLAARVTDLGRELATTRAHLAQYHTVMEQDATRLVDIENKPSTKDIQGILHWIKSVLSEPPQPSDPKKDLLANDTVLRIMSAHVKIQPSNHEFWLDGNETLLEAGVRSGLALNYGCTSGNCGLCKARVVSGEVRTTRHYDYVLSEAEKNMGYMLMCSCTAVSDVVVEALEASEEQDIPKQEIVTRIKKIDQPAPDILSLHLQTPRTQRLRFLAGQSLTLYNAAGASSNQPIASCPCDDRNLIFHLQRNSGDTFIEELFAGTQKGDEITVVGPHGNFLFHEESPRPQIYLAFGIGFAPIKSLIEHAMARDSAENMYLYWASPDKEGLYAHNLCRSWADALEEFNYVPVVAADPVDTLLTAHPTLTEFDVYVAGAEGSVTSAVERLCQAGLPPQQLATDVID